MKKQMYAVMRHAHYINDGEISDIGHNQIVLAAEKFNEFSDLNNISKVEIWHSPMLRAKNTAEIFSKQLKIESSLLEKVFLSCDYAEIQDNLPIENKVFILMISHQPDIEKYLRRTFMNYSSVKNCDIFVGSEKI